MNDPTPTKPDLEAVERLLVLVKRSTTPWHQCIEEAVPHIRSLMRENEELKEKLRENDVWEKQSFETYEEVVRLQKLSDRSQKENEELRRRNDFLTQKLGEFLMHPHPQELMARVLSLKATLAAQVARNDEMFEAMVELAGKCRSCAGVARDSDGESWLNAECPECSPLWRVIDRIKPTSDKTAGEDVSTPPPAKAVDGWISVEERLPDVKEGREKTVIVTFKSELGRDCVGEAHYLNRYELLLGFDYEPKPEDEYDEDDCTMKWTGFCWLTDENSDEEFQKITQKITHWMPMPPPPVSPVEDQKVREG